MTTEQTFWQLTAGVLLDRHFGLTLSDTNLCEEHSVMQLQQAGQRPFEVINELVDKYGFTRLEHASSYRPRSPYLNAGDEVIAALELNAQQ